MTRTSRSGLKRSQLLFDGGSYHPACFTTQQTAEKALKAFYVIKRPRARFDKSYHLC
ncbi:MAG: HEPN domain-containing protein [Anaerolineae bacterium]